MNDSQKIWLDGTLVDEGQAKVSVFDHGLLYGDGCFEGIRIYRGKIFKLASHLERLFASARRIRLESPYSIAQVETAVRETVAANKLEDGYIRLVFTRGVGNLGLNPFHCKTPTVFVIASKIQMYPEALYRDGMGVIIADRRRTPASALDPRVKSLNYLNNIMAKIEAIDAGVLEAIMLNESGDVSECTGDNIFIVKDGHIVTPPTDSGILEGITRQFVMEHVAPHCGHEVLERKVTLDDLYGADEVFLTGTAAEVIGVTKIGQTEIADHKVGPITRQLTAAFRTLVQDAPED